MCVKVKNTVISLIYQQEDIGSTENAWGSMLELSVVGTNGRVHDTRYFRIPELQWRSTGVSELSQYMALAGMRTSTGVANHKQTQSTAHFRSFSARESLLIFTETKHHRDHF